MSKFAKQTIIFIVASLIFALASATYVKGVMF